MVWGLSNLIECVVFFHEMFAVIVNYNIFLFLDAAENASFCLSNVGEAAPAVNFIKQFTLFDIPVFFISE